MLTDPFCKLSHRQNTNPGSSQDIAPLDAARVCPEETRNLRCLFRHFTEQHGSTCISHELSARRCSITVSDFHQHKISTFIIWSMNVMKPHTLFPAFQATNCYGTNPIFEQHNVSCLWDSFYCHYWHLAVNFSCTQEQYAHLTEYHGLKFRRFSKTQFQLTSHCVCVWNFNFTQ